jgi:hypothetical protein
MACRHRTVKIEHVLDTLRGTCKWGSSRSNTSSYSRASGTERWISNRPVPTKVSKRKALPRLERNPATMPLVSMTMCRIDM